MWVSLLASQALFAPAIRDLKKFWQAPMTRCIYGKRNILYIYAYAWSVSFLCAANVRWPLEIILHLFLGNPNFVDRHFVWRLFLITTSMRAKNSSCNTGMAIKLFFEQDLEAKQYCADFYGFNKPNNPWTNCNPSRAEPSGSCQQSCRLLAARLEHLNKFFSFWLGTTFGSAA